MAKGVLRVRIVGDERELTSSLKRANTEVGKFSGGVSGALKGLALLGGGAALVGGFKKAIDQTVQWGSEVKTLTRELGLSAETASALALASEHYGVGVDVLSRGLGIFEKHLVANDKAFLSLGISARGANGQLLPMDQVLGKVQAKFAKLPDGPEKTALALNLFGRNGKALLPFLNAGPDAMKRFSEEAKKLGLSLSGADLDSITRYKFATRDFTAALHGLEVQVGLKTIPALTTFAHIATAGVEGISHIPTGVLTAAAAFGTFVLAVQLASKFTGAAKEAIGSVVGGLKSLVVPAHAAAVAQTEVATTATVAATRVGFVAASEVEAAAAADRYALAQKTAAASSGGLLSSLGGIISKGAGATLTLGAVAGYLYATGRAAKQAASDGETFANAFTAAVGTGPQGVQKIKDEIGSLQLELNKAERLTGGRNLFQALTFWKPSDKDRLKAQIKDLKGVLKDLGIQADATGAASVTALSKIEESLQGTSTFQDNLKRLVAEGVPLQVANQLKTMGQDGIDAAQQLVDGTQEARDAFVALAEAASGTALSGMRDTFTATIHLNSALKALVSEGVPQSVADQLKTIPGAAEELLNATPKVRAEFVKMALAASDTGTAVDKLVGHFNDLKTASDHFKTALDATLGATLNVQEATARYDEDLAALGTSLKANGRSFDLNTEKGRNNSQALRTLVGDIQDQISALVQSGKVSGTDAAQKSILLQKLRDLERKFPALKGQIDTYIGAVNKIPLEHVTKIGIKTPSKAQIQKAADNVINHFDTRFDKEGGIPVSIKPQFTTPSLTVTATNVYLSSGGTRSAEGRIVRAPMFTQVGEGGHPEVIVPLDPAKKARRDQLLRESGLMKEILAKYGVKLADGALVSGRSGGSSIPASLPSSLYSVAAVRAPSPSVSSVTYDDHSTVIVNNPVPERLSETLPAIRRRKQLLRGH